MKPAVVQDSKDGAVHGDALKIRVAAPPVDGAANDELIRFLSRELSVPASAVHIESGSSGRHKRVRLYGVTAERVIACLMQKGPVRK
jgi:uncharacterized protein (TIGR00251 family)